MHRYKKQTYHSQVKLIFSQSFPLWANEKAVWKRQGENFTDFRLIQNRKDPINWKSNKLSLAKRFGEQTNQNLIKRAQSCNIKYPII